MKEINFRMNIYISCIGTKINIIGIRVGNPYPNPGSAQFFLSLLESEFGIRFLIVDSDS